MLVCVSDVFSMTNQCYDNQQGRFTMFKEDSLIDFAEENVILNFSFRPLPACMFHSETDNQFKKC